MKTLAKKVKEIISPLGEGISGKIWTELDMYGIDYEYTSHCDLDYEVIDKEVSDKQLVEIVERLQGFVEDFAKEKENNIQLFINMGDVFIQKEVMPGVWKTYIFD